MPVLLKKYYFLPYKEAGGIGFIRKKAVDLHSAEVALVSELELLNRNDSNYHSKLMLVMKKLPSTP